MQANLRLLHIKSSSTWASISIDPPCPTPFRIAISPESCRLEGTFPLIFRKEEFNRCRRHDLFPRHAKVLKLYHELLLLLGCCCYISSQHHPPTQCLPVVVGMVWWCQVNEFRVVVGGDGEQNLYKHFCCTTLQIGILASRNCCWLAGLEQPASQLVPEIARILICAPGILNARISRYWI